MKKQQAAWCRLRQLEASTADFMEEMYLESVYPEPVTGKERQIGEGNAVSEIVELSEKWV